MSQLVGLFSPWDRDIGCESSKDVSKASLSGLVFDTSLGILKWVEACVGCCFGVEASRGEKMLSTSAIECTGGTVATLTPLALPKI